MPVIDCLIHTDIVRTPRVLQLEGLFDVPAAQRSERRFSVKLPIEDQPWNIGLIVGPSGSGKTTVARQAFGQNLIHGFDWPADKSLIDGFPAGMGIKEITGLLSSVGFSSPPSWLRPFRCLSNGEQFRATLARALAESPELAVIDEFTSVVDRTVAQIGSAAVAKSVRRANRKLVAVSCHYDIIDWLDPDWILEMPSGEFTRRSLQGRPPIELAIKRTRRSAWSLFKAHHYMSAEHHPGAYCFTAFWRDRPVAYCSVVSFPHATRPGWKEHRTVCLPDYQGVGIGNALSEYVASLFAATGKPYRDVTAHPGHCLHRIKSPLWKTKGQPKLNSNSQRRSTIRNGRGMTQISFNRLTMSFEYVGPKRPEDARAFGLKVP